MMPDRARDAMTTLPTWACSAFAAFLVLSVRVIGDDTPPVGDVVKRASYASSETQDSRSELVYDDNA
jgi:hypothetical protein